MPFPNNRRWIPFLSEKIHILVAITIPGQLDTIESPREFVASRRPSCIYRDGNGATNLYFHGYFTSTRSLLENWSKSRHRFQAMTHKRTASNSSPEETLSLLDRETRVDETRRSIHPISFTVETRAREGDAWPLAKSVSGYIGSAASFAATHKFGRW